MVSTELYSTVCTFPENFSVASGKPIFTINKKGKEREGRKSRKEKKGSKVRSKTKQRQSTKWVKEEKNTECGAGNGMR